MVDLGVVALGVFNGDGQPAKSNPDAKQEEQAVVLKVTTDHGEVGICLLRGALSALLAHPNEDVAVDCSITMEGNYDRPESE